MNRAFLFRLQCKHDTHWEDILIAYVPDTFDAHSFTTVIEAEIEKDLLPDELLILVRSTEASATENTFQTDSGLDGLKERFGKKAQATLASFDVGGKIVARQRLWGAGAACKLSADVVQRQGATHLFNLRQGHIPATANFHFCNPSGKHTERFVRISNILVKPSEISFLAFCLLPHIPKELPYCYVDTASLLPLVSAVNDHRRAFGADPPQLIVDSFASYDGVELSGFEREAQGFVLISASSSGGLARRLMKVQPSFGSDRIIHVLFHDTDPAPFPAVVDLRFDKNKNPGGLHVARSFEAHACALCQEGSKPIPLHGEQFHFAGPQNEPVLVNKTPSPPGLGDLLSRYAGKDIFRVGRGGTTGTAPRLFAVSADKLTDDPEFQKRIDYAARRLVPAGVKQVVLLNEDSRAFAEALIAKSGIAPPPKCVLSKDIDQVTGSDPLLIVGIVIESGRSLQDISHDLRTQCQNAPQTFVVGLFKVNSPGRSESISRTLIQTDHPVRHEFVVLETLVLPSSDARNSWNREHAFLTDLSAKSPDQEIEAWLNERRELLGSNLTMDDNLFVDNAADNHIKIQSGFVFWPRTVRDGTQAEIFYVVSSVLQHLRASPAKSAQSIQSNWFQQTLLSPENFARYNDAAVQASFLRAAKPEELNYGADFDRSRDMVRVIRRVLESAERARGAAAAEMLLAVATRRLRLHPVVLKELLQPIEPPPPPRVAFLFDWLKTHEQKLM